MCICDNVCVCLCARARVLFFLIFYFIYIDINKLLYNVQNRIAYKKNGSFYIIKVHGNWAS